MREAAVVLDLGKTFFEEPFFGFEGHNAFLVKKKAAIEVASRDAC
jgi:hypothetical protein